jgi:hypothetical protein
VFLGPGPIDWLLTKHFYYVVDDRETPEHAQTRLRGFLGYSFESMPETCESFRHPREIHLPNSYTRPLDISITSHSSTLRALLDVLDHPHKKFETAEVIPLVVKATVHSKEQVKEEEKEKKEDDEKKTEERK